MILAAGCLSHSSGSAACSSFLHLTDRKQLNAQTSPLTSTGNHEVKQRCGKKKVKVSHQRLKHENCFYTFNCEMRPAVSLEEEEEGGGGGWRRRRGRWRRRVEEEEEEGQMEE